MEGLVSILAEECTGTVAGVTAQNQAGEAIDLELLLLPLGVRRPSFARAIGVLAPLKVPAWLGATPIRRNDARRPAGISAPRLVKRLLPRFMASRARRGLKVYDGGRQDAPNPAHESGPTARVARPQNHDEDGPSAA